MQNNYKPLRIAGIGYSVPDTVITNNDLTKLYDTSDEWIYTRTGIKERRIVSGNESAVDLGVEASKNAIEKSGIKLEDIDCIVAASSVPPQLYPSLACHIQAYLGIPNHIPAFDMTAACSGLIYALQVARGLIGSGLYKNILIVAADNNSRHVDWSDRGTSILFGDGAGAMVVTASEDDVDDVLGSLSILITSNSLPGPVFPVGRSVVVLLSTVPLSEVNVLSGPACGEVLGGRRQVLSQPLSTSEVGGAQHEGAGVREFQGLVQDLQSG